MNVRAENDLIMDSSYTKIAEPPTDTEGPLRVVILPLVRINQRSRTFTVKAKLSKFIPVS